MMASGNSDNEKKYLWLVELFKKANPTLDKSKQYIKAQELWNSVKNDQSLSESKLNELKVKATKSQASLLAFWGKASSPPSKKRRKTQNPQHQKTQNPQHQKTQNRQHRRRTT